MLPEKCKSVGCFNPGWCRDGRCGEHTRDTREHASYHYSPEPKTDRPHLGIEMEFVCPSAAVFQQVRAMKRNVCHDGSIGPLGGEMKVLGESPKVFAPAMNAASHLSERGARANSSCGFHVHMDRRDVHNSRTVEFRGWVKAYLEPWFFAMMPPSRRDNPYCTPIRDSRSFNISRYEWLSVTAKQTLEVRLHGGTLHPYKIQGWLSVCHDLMGILRSGDSFPSMTFNTMTHMPENLRNVFPTPAAQEYLTARTRSKGILITSSRDEERMDS